MEEFPKKLFKVSSFSVVAERFDGDNPHLDAFKSFILFGNLEGRATGAHIVTGTYSGEPNWREETRHVWQSRFVGGNGFILNYSMSWFKQFILGETSYRKEFYERQGGDYINDPWW